MRGSRLVVAALGFAVLWGTAVSWAGPPPNVGVAPEKSAGKKPEPARKAKSAESVLRTGEEAIEAALAKPIACQFFETPLKDVIEYFKDAAQVEIFLDCAALKDAGVDEAESVNCNFRGLRFEKVLNRILDPLKLKWTIHDDMLCITSRDKADSDEFYETRLYDVADLVVYQDQDGKKIDDYAPLTSLITNIIDTKCWVDNGGLGTIQGESLGTAKVLVVSHRYDVHKQITALLAEIRKIAAKKSGGDGLPFRERPKAEKAATFLGCPHIVPGPSATKDAAPPAKPAEK